MRATFEQWVDAVFNHPVEKPEWYWSENFDSVWQRLGTSEPRTVNFLRQLFENLRNWGSTLSRKLAREYGFLSASRLPRNRHTHF